MQLIKNLISKYLTSSSVLLYAGGIILLALAFIYVQHQKIGVLDSRIENQNVIIDERNKQIDSILSLYEKEKKLTDELYKNQVAYNNNLKEKENEIEILNARVKSGSSKLLIGAKCESPGVSKAKDSTGVVAGNAELDSEARQAYFDLRSGIVKYEEMYNLCMATLRSYQ